MANNNPKPEKRLVHTFSDADAERVAAEMLHLRFMRTVKVMMGEKRNSDLAEALGTSKAYISKLFYGDKLLNMKLLSQCEKIFDGRFVLTFKRNASILNLAPDKDSDSFTGGLGPNSKPTVADETIILAA